MPNSSMTITETTHRTPKKIKVAWLSDDATGAVSGTTTKYYSGKIVGVTTVPGTGAAAPDDNYDVVANDADSVDVLMSGGLNRDTANAEHVLSASLGMVVESKLTIAVTNAGNANSGTVYIFVQ